MNVAITYDESVMLADPEVVLKGVKQSFSLNPVGLARFCFPNWFLSVTSDDSWLSAGLITKSDIYNLIFSDYFPAINLRCS